MRVHDVLAAKASPAIHTIHPAATLPDLLTTLAEHGVGALIVSDGTDDQGGPVMTGIVSERDVVRALAGDVQRAADLTVADLMSTDIRVCAPDDTVEDLMSTMTTYRVRHVPVFQDARLVGLLSIGDAVKQRMDELEFERDQLSHYVAGG